MRLIQTIDNDEFYPTPATLVEQYAYAHYEKGFPAECENWYWNKKENKLVYCPQ